MAEWTTRSRCPTCGSTELMTIVVPVEGSLISVAYCSECARPNWEDVKEHSLETVLQGTSSSSDDR